MNKRKRRNNIIGVIIAIAILSWMFTHKAQVECIVKDIAEEFSETIND